MNAPPRQTNERPRSGRRVALVACYPLRDPAMPGQFISNHGMRMVEAALRSSALPGLELEVFDLTVASSEGLVTDLLSMDPDVVGFSTYLWSFPFFMEVAEALKNTDPTRVVVLGGPAARPSMFALAPHRRAAAFVDALVINEGEQTFVEVVAQTDRRGGNLRTIAGVAVPENGGWFETPPRALGDLNELASPYQLGLVPDGGLGVLQTYRGCPFTCSFCEWGTLESPKRVRDADNLSTELDAMADNRVAGALLVDAGLNLNQRGFRNLAEAAAQTGFFAERQVICEVYPAKIQDEHIAFLQEVGRPLVGVGLQSFDNKVLSHVERSYDERRFEENLARLRGVAGVAIEIILGLPGDSPEGFRRTFERARGFGCTVRVYHCVVLPSALMVRAPPSYAMDFDPYSLKMRSCLGWEEAALDAEQSFLARQAAEHGGHRGDYFWVFPAWG